ncbi:hypothetical protein PCASD_20671 [Puccinia coronata f. sp. avenae]|nr:hypothetical protein PCASD_20671 [Puccinia coronata f. sp. avenae]
MGSILPSKETPSSFAQTYVTGGNDLAEATCRAFQAHCPVDSLILLEIQQYLSQHNTYARFFRLIGRKEASRNSPEYHLRNYLRSDLDQNVYNAPRTLEGWIYGMPSGTEREQGTALPALTGQTRQFERCSNSRVRPVVGQALSNQSTCRRVGQACPISSWDRSHRTSRDRSDKSVQPVGSCFGRTVPVRPPVEHGCSSTARTAVFDR